MTWPTSHSHRDGRAAYLERVMLERPVIERPVSQTETAVLLQFSPSQVIWATSNAKAKLEAKGLGNSSPALALDVVIDLAKKHIDIRTNVLLNEGQPANPLLMASDRKVDLT